jgi:hypothetical protein
MPDHLPETAVAEVLTPLAKQVLDLGGAAAYGRLVVDGPGPATADARKLLQKARPEQLFARPAVDNEAARAVLAGLWLWHDCLHESHEISQELASPTGSFWHAILHRREGDFWNSKYWYARCPSHPVLRTIAVGAGTILGADPATRSTQAGVGDTFTVANGFNPAAFVDWVEELHDRPADLGYRKAVAVQRLEWRTLFADCAFAAVGAGSILGGGIES